MTYRFEKPTLVNPQPYLELNNQFAIACQKLLSSKAGMQETNKLLLV